MKPNFNTRTFSLSTANPDLRLLKFPLIGDFIWIETAATGFELSFDNDNFIPVREGLIIKTAEPFQEFWARPAGANSAVTVKAIIGNGSISSFATYGTFNPAVPAAAAPFGSHADLGNSPTVSLQTGVYAMVITGSPPAFEVWQLRAYTGGGTPATDIPNGLIVPADYNAGTNNRVWYKTL